MSEKKNMTGKENSFHMENFRRRSRYAAVFLVLILAFAAITVLNINSGNVNISIPEIFRILLRRTGEGKAYNIIWKIRLPRILMAAILGGALSLSGFLLQTFFENPIAGPFVLGISSGAKMVVALTMIFYLEWARNITSYTMIVAAFLGSLLSVGFILLMSRRIKNMAVNVGTINRMEINKRGAGGIVAQMTIYGDKRQISIVNQNQIRKILSSYYSTIKLSDKTKRTKLSMLPSAFISIKSVYKNNKLDGIKIYGGGFGHGSGMSQSAACQMAKKGKGYKEILATFYNDVEITSLQ